MPKLLFYTDLWLQSFFHLVKDCSHKSMPERQYAAEKLHLKTTMSFLDTVCVKTLTIALRSLYCVIWRFGFVYWIATSTVDRSETILQN